MKKKRLTREEKAFIIIGKITTMILFSTMFGALIAYGLWNCTILN